MKEYINNILIVLFLSLMVIGCMQTVGTITGKVTDNGGSPVVGAIVFVEQEGHADVTDESGTYTIENVPLGDYTVTATFGTITNSEEATIVDETFSCTPPQVEVDIKLDI